MYLLWAKLESLILCIEINPPPIQKGNKPERTDPMRGVFKRSLTAGDKSSLPKSFDLPS